jgi:protein-L-isoaspartate(D-aspartate) O-methyltransferase
MSRALNRTALYEFDPPRARELRSRLVEQLERGGELRDGRVREALLRIPRHLFVPAETPLDHAYADHSVPIGHGQAIAQPSVVARMTEALELSGTERILEIGTGSGYHAAVLSELAAEVLSIEALEPLARRAAHLLAEIGCSNVVVRAGDGNEGWSRRAPFERIVSGAAAEEVPKAWIDQLSEGGFVVAPVGGAWGGQRLVRVLRYEGQTRMDDLGAIAFVPLLAG